MRPFRRVTFSPGIRVVDDDHCSINCVFFRGQPWQCSADGIYLETEDVGPVRTDGCKYREMYHDYLYNSGLLPDNRPPLPKVRGSNGEKLYEEWVERKGQP